MSWLGECAEMFRNPHLSTYISGFLWSEMFQCYAVVKLGRKWGSRGLEFESRHSDQENASFVSWQKRRFVYPGIDRILGRFLCLIKDRGRFSVLTDKDTEPSPVLWADCPAYRWTGEEDDDRTHGLRERCRFSTVDASEPGKGNSKAQKRASFFAANLKTDRGQPDDHTNDTGKVNNTENRPLCYYWE